MNTGTAVRRKTSCSVMSMRITLAFALVLGLGSLLAACASAEVSTTTEPVTTTSEAPTTTEAAAATTAAVREVKRIGGVTFMTRQDDGLVPTQLRSAKVDIFAPSEGGGPWPVVVCIFGEDWASEIAQRGAVVFVPECDRTEGVSGYSPEEVRAILSGQNGDAAAAVRFARATAEQYGGDPTNVTLFGFSHGANQALMVALSGASPSEGAVAGAGSTVPESLVLFDPDYVAADPTWDPILAADPDPGEVMALMTPWRHLGRRMDFPVVVLDSGDLALSRGLGDPWAKDSWLALRDPSGDIRRGLEELGALSSKLFTNRSAAPLLIERLKAEGATVTYIPLADSSHGPLGPQGLESLLQALVPNAKNE